MVLFLGCGSLCCESIFLQLASQSGYRSAGNVGGAGRTGTIRHFRDFAGAVVETVALNCIVGFTTGRCG